MTSAEGRWLYIRRLVSIVMSEYVVELSYTSRDWLALRCVTSEEVVVLSFVRRVVSIVTSDDRGDVELHVTRL